jgi:hypothetical protein
MSERPDQRKAERVQPFVVRCLIVDGARRVPGYLTDLSVTGAQVTVESDAPAPGASVVVEVRLGRGVDVTARRLPATVQWARSGDPPRSFGVIFQIDDGERSAIEAVLADFRRRVSQI